MDNDKELKKLMIENSLAACINAGAVYAALKSDMHWTWKALIAFQFGAFVAKDSAVVFLASIAKSKDDTPKTEEES